MAFTAQDVKTLREITGCGMMDCKRRWPRLTAIRKKQSNCCVKRAWQLLPKRLAASLLRVSLKHM